MRAPARVHFRFLGSRPRLGAFSAHVTDLPRNLKDTRLPSASYSLAVCGLLQYNE